MMIRHRLDAAKILAKEQRTRSAARGFRGHGPRGYGRGGGFGMGRGKGRGRGSGAPRRGW